jgi:hypothetical protein
MRNFEDRTEETQELISMLRANCVHNFFHVTHRDNLSSIFEKGLLCAANHASHDVNPKYYSSDASRYVEARRDSLDRYVKLSFIPCHPMFQGRLDCVSLEVDLDYVCSIPEIKLCRVNSIKKNAKLEDAVKIKTLNFKVLTECIEKQKKDMSYSPKWGTENYTVIQAEILVPLSVPPKAIKTLTK